MEQINLFDLSEIVQEDKKIVVIKNEIIKENITGTKVVNIKKRGITYDRYIGRGVGEQGKWGNPFIIGDEDGWGKSFHNPEFYCKTRDEACDRHMEWILTQTELLDSLHELKGKVLGCFCKPKRCHGDNLIILIESGKYC